jgi:hypothetical protein
MKLSKSAYNIASYIVDSPYTLHDLLATLTKVEDILLTEAIHILKLGLTELASNGLIEWTYEPDYGNMPSIRPNTFNDETFCVDWQRCIEKGELRPGVPNRNAPTLLIDRSPRLRLVYEDLHPNKDKP